MGKMKFFLITVAIFIGFIIIGDMNKSYADFFAGFKSIGVGGDYVTLSDTVRDIETYAEKHNIMVAICVYDNSELTKSKNTYFGTNGFEEFVKNEYNVVSKKYRSLFSGELTVDFQPLSNFANYSENLHNLYFIIGSDADIAKWQADMSNSYVLTKIFDGGENPRGEFISTLITVWILIIILALFLTYYGCLLSRTEKFIRLTYGESLLKITLLNVITDTLIYLTIFFSAISFVSNFSNLSCFFSYSVVLFCILIITNSLLHLTTLKINPKFSLSNVLISKKALSINYIMKSFSSVLVLIILSTNISIISECIEYYNQKDYFKAHKDYAYVNFNEDSINQLMLDTDSFYRKYFMEYDIQVNYTQFRDNNDLAVYLANINIVPYLNSVIPGLSDIDLSTADVFVIYPEERNYTKDDINSIAHSIYDPGIEPNKVKSFKYPKAKIIAFSNNTEDRSEWVKNPTIALQTNTNYKVTEDFENSTLRRYMLGYSIMKTDKSVIESYANKHNMTYTYTPVMVLYESRFIIYKNALYINLILSILLISLEFIIIFTIIKLEFHANAIEQALKKIHGDTLFSRMKKLFVIIIVSTIISLILAIIISKILNFGEPIFILISNLILIVLEILTIIYFINKYEKENLRKILNGGS